jgi:hypothetical protein
MSTACLYFSFLSLHLTILALLLILRHIIHIFQFIAGTFPTPSCPLCSCWWCFSHFSFSFSIYFYLPINIVILTPSARPANEKLTHVMNFNLKNLLPGSVYEAIVQAKNAHGKTDKRLYKWILFSIIIIPFLRIFSTSISMSRYF